MSEENIYCPYCGYLVQKHGMHDHLSFYCPAVLRKASRRLFCGGSAASLSREAKVGAFGAPQILVKTREGVVRGWAKRVRERRG